MMATFETTGGVLRLCPNDDPNVYDLSLCVVGVHGVAHLMALTAPTGGLTVRHKAAIFKALRDAGFTSVHWQRREPVASGGATRDEIHIL